MQPEQVNPSGNKTQNTDKTEGKENHLDVNRFFSKNQSNSKNHLVSSNHTLFSIKRKRSSWKSVHYITDEKKSGVSLFTSQLFRPSELLSQY